jgi:hypothetical protein
LLLLLCRAVQIDVLVQQLQIAVRLNNAGAAMSLVERLKKRDALAVLQQRDEQGHSFMHWAAKVCCLCLHTATLCCYLALDRCIALYWPANILTFKDIT